MLGFFVFWGSLLLKMYLPTDSIFRSKQLSLFSLNVTNMADNYTYVANMADNYTYVANNVTLWKKSKIRSYLCCLKKVTEKLIQKVFLPVGWWVEIGWIGRIDGLRYGGLEELMGWDRMDRKNWWVEIEWIGRIDGLR